MRAPLERVLASLEGVKANGDGYLARCPAHDDHRQSLSVTEGEDGRVLLNCFAGCEASAICEAMGIKLADLFPPREKVERQIVDAYDYTDEEGELLFQVVRFAPKDFRQRRPDGVGGWIWNLKGVRRVLFNLPRVLGAVRLKMTVFIVEGEKDVAALESLGAVATCNPGGAGKWRDEYSEVLRGAQVVIVADADEAGRNHARQVAGSLAGVAAAVRIVEAAEGKDAADHIAAGHGLEEFTELEAETQTEEACSEAPPATETSTKSASLPRLVADAAHAEVLHGAWKGEYRYADHQRIWRHWDGKVWEGLPEAVIAASACQLLCRHYADELLTTGEPQEMKRLRALHQAACRYRSVTDGLAFLRGQEGFHTEPEEWDADPYLLNCADGMLDLRTQRISPHDPKELCTRITRWGLATDGGKSSGAWQRHLEKCLPDPDVRRQLQRDLGRGLVDAVLEHSLSIWYGIGRNGKSTTSEAIRKGLGEYASEGAKDLLIETRHEAHSTEIAELAGRRIIFTEEIADNKSLNEAQVKRLTGGGPKRAHFMRQDNFDVLQTFSISLLVNHRPRVRGGDPGIWERLRLIPWTVQIPFAEQRPQEEVVEELMADGAWMLRWLVAGFADWQADEHWIAEGVEAAKRDYRAEEDELQGFIDRCCIEEQKASIPMGELYEAWAADYAVQNPNAKVPSKKAFGKMLRDRGITVGKEGHAKTRVYIGITLKERPEQAEMELE